MSCGEFPPSSGLTRGSGSSEREGKLRLFRNIQEFCQQFAITCAQCTAVLSGKMQPALDLHFDSVASTRLLLWMLVPSWVIAVGGRSHFTYFSQRCFSAQSNPSTLLNKNISCRLPTVIAGVTHCHACQREERSLVVGSAKSK
jgi:hypothetical protein